MNDSENNANARVVAELKATLAAAAEKRINGESEPAFVYVIEPRENPLAGEQE